GADLLERRLAEIADAGTRAGHDRVALEGEIAASVHHRAEAEGKIPPGVRRSRVHRVEHGTDERAAGLSWRGRRQRVGGDVGLAQREGDQGDGDGGDDGGGEDRPARADQRLRAWFSASPSVMPKPRLSPASFI